MKEKPIVHYVGPVVGFGKSVSLIPVDHRNHADGQSVRNGRPAITSTVVSWDRDTGRVETLNTIYMPLVVNPDDIE